MKKIAIIGAGLAGLAAAVKLLTEGGDSVEVHLYEQSRFMGGRVSSFVEGTSGKLLDAVQHVSMKCCDATMRFLECTGLDVCGSFQKEIVFGGYRFSRLRNSPFLPAPFHLLGSVLRLKFLTFGQRLSLLALTRRVQKETPPEDVSFSAWLETLGCEKAIRRLFWDTLVLSAFSDSAENVPARMAKNILTRMLMDRADGWHLWVPDRPLRMIFHDEMLRFLRKFPRFHFHPLTQIKRMPPEGDGIHDATIMAVPWHAAARILPELTSRSILKTECFVPRTIAAVHAWYDRPLFSPGRNVAIPGMTTQWIFRHPWGDADFPTSHGVYHQLMLSDSDTCCSPRPEVIQNILTAESQEMFPAAKLLHAKTVCVPASVFSPAAAEHFRPKCVTPWRNIFLAGDWTDTGFPATMEGAIRSGETAAEVLNSECVIRNA